MIEGMCSYRPDDAHRIAAFLRDVHRQDPRFDGPEDDAFAAFVAQPSNRGGADFVIATVHGEIAAVLLSARASEMDRDRDVRSFKVIVHPDARGRGLGERLLAAAERQDPAGKVVWRTVIDAELRALGSVLEHRGYGLKQTILLMRRTGIPPMMGTLPPGLTLRDADPVRDAEVITQLYNVAHRSAFGFAPISQADLQATLGAPGGRLMVVESVDGEVIGSAQTLPFYDRVGVLHALEIAPHWQGRGLGKYLAKAAIEALAQSGFRTVDLAVDAENGPAVGLYRGLGFVVARRDLTYEAGGR